LWFSIVGKRLISYGFLTIAHNYLSLAV